MRCIDMVEEKDADAFRCKCPKCGHKWDIERGEWIMFSGVMKGKNPHCPKCGNSRILWKPIKYEY